MVLAIISIAVLGSIVWAHHMYTVGMELDTRAYFSAVTMLISLPTGNKTFNWINTYLIVNNNILRQSNLWQISIFLITFSIGGSTGIILGNSSVDIALHDTYHVVAHFHYILSLGTTLALVSGLLGYINLYVSSNSMNTTVVSKGIVRTSSCRKKKTVVLAMLYTGVLTTFTPLHFLRFSTMPRRIPDYNDETCISWNTLSSLGSGITILSVFLLNYRDCKLETINLSVYYYIKVGGPVLVCNYRYCSLREIILLQTEHYQEWCS